MKFPKLTALIAVIAIFSVTLFPSVTSAQTITTTADIQLLGEADLKVVKIGGNCDGIYLEAKKLFDISEKVKKLDLKLKYKVFWAKSGDPVSGEAVGEGEVTVNESKDSYKVNYDPTANPNGPAGEYAFQFFLETKGGETVTSKKIITKVKINGNCKEGGKEQPQPEGNDQGDKDHEGNHDNNEEGTNSNNQEGSQQQNDGKNGGNGKGGKMPKTASPYANTILFGLASVLIGLIAIGAQRKVS